MGGNVILPAVDTLVLTLPFLGILALAMFGLDERLAAPKRDTTRPRFFCEVEGKGKSFVSDPDGTPWQKGAVRQIEATLHNTPRSRRKTTPVKVGSIPLRTPATRTYIIER